MKTNAHISNVRDIQRVHTRINITHTYTRTHIYTQTGAQVQSNKVKKINRAEAEGYIFAHHKAFRQATLHKVTYMRQDNTL